MTTFSTLASTLRMQKAEVCGLLASSRLDLWVMSKQYNR
jgi:hypothetical protein